MRLSSDAVQAGVGLTVLVATAIVAFMAVRGGANAITTFVAGYFLVYGFGPVVNYLTGSGVYVGTVPQTVGTASVGMCVALVGICAGTLIRAQRTRFDRTKLENDGRIYPAVTVLQAALSLYAVGILAIHGTALGAANKAVKIATVGTFHYDYLFLALLASALYLTAVRTRTGRQIFWAHLITYTAYCLLTDERDFIFVYFSLFLHSRLFREKTSILVPVFAGGSLLALATYLFAERSGGSADTSQALNQGSLLFVDSYISARYPDFESYRWGGTYVDAIASLLPSWLVTPQANLTDQLVQSYAPGSSGGYGFSLTAEARMNFGLIGILVVFFGLAILQQVLINRIDHSLFWAYASIVFTAAWMYAIRGESAQLLKVCFDAALLYWGVSVTSLRSEPAVSGRRLGPWRSVIIRRAQHIPRSGTPSSPAVR